MKSFPLLTLRLAIWAGAALPSLAQEPVPPPAPAVASVAATDLDSWLAPIALYPDPLLAQVLAAATQPSDIVQADRYLSNGGDPSLLDQQPWDPSVKALARYPSVLKLMDDYIGWTTELGQAFLYQQPEVMDEIQRLRARALELGNLESTPQENILTDDGSIEILPAEPDVIYVPEYETDVVYMQHPIGPPCISFGPGFAMGRWMDRDFDWHQRHLLAWDHVYARPADWWSSRRPAPGTARSPGHQHHPEDPTANPRTRTTHFVNWQIPRVRVVTSANLPGRGWEPREIHPTPHSDRPAGFKPEGSTLLVLPSHSSASPGHRTVSSAGIHVYSSSTPGHREAFSGEHHATDPLIGAESTHDTVRFSQRGHESRESGSHSAPASHSPGTSHTAAPSHSGGSSGRH